MPVDALGPFGADPQRAGVFLDFDGTLSDITEDPSDAVPRAGVPELLAALGQRLGRVVVVSGRPLRHLDPMLPAAVDIV
ncbi:MAG: trehalose-phosphatase, partial [Actinobacteria bacterium]|nr:trehalose-phosphatase [Actinomycetota bacterium]NIS29217.1 trehalose-phosphatase [Actinomycetota bacterium]NIT94402.1 trehalose-phosphatase [Actinomycetota bacterium]NIU18012.1 trehalose-phosphatase [Actinomycetota bacterium]NIU64613.1 trehalose-phosphatase [Actinomycetota bacterium]